MLKYHSQVGIITNSSTELFVIPKPPENLKELLQAMIDLHNLITGNKVEYFDVFDELEIYSQEQFNEDNEARKNWLEMYGTDYSWGYEEQENVGNTMLRSANDNTIPYWMQELIESLPFEIRRFHLG